MFYQNLTVKKMLK